MARVHMIRCYRTILFLLTLSQVVTLYHSLIHDHVLCIEHGQIEEASHGTSHIDAHKGHGSSLQECSEDSEHSACSIFSGPRPHTYTTFYISAPVDFNHDILPSRHAYWTSHKLIHLAPKASPPKLV